MPLRSEAQPARSREVERAGITGDLPDHAHKVAATHPFLDRKQRILGLAHGDVD